VYATVLIANRILFELKNIKKR